MDKFVNIEKNIIESAKIVSCKIDDAELRKRAYALFIVRSHNEDDILSYADHHMIHSI